MLETSFTYWSKWTTSISSTISYWTNHICFTSVWWTAWIWELDFYSL